MLYQARQCHASHVVVDDINLFSCLTMYIIVDDSSQLTVSSKIAGSCFASLNVTGGWGGDKDYKLSNKDNKYIYLKIFKFRMCKLSEKGFFAL